MKVDSFDDEQMNCVRKITRVVWPQDFLDWMLVAKAVVLRDRLSADWLWDAVEAVRHRRECPKNVNAYFYGCLRGNAEERGFNLSDELRNAEVSGRLVRSLYSATQPERRLCDATNPGF